LRRLVCVLLLTGVATAIGGCPKPNTDYQAGRRAEAVNDYDTAVVHYQKALNADPNNAEYKLRTTRARFTAGQFHVEQGQKALKRGDLQLALAEFQKAQAIDPSSSVADQEAQRTLDLLAKEKAAE
jgi:tetratricopeptide (TPR) repeat protein